MASTIYLLYYMVQKTSFEITLKFLYGLMYGIKEAIQPYMSYVWFLRNIYGCQPGLLRPYDFIITSILLLLIRPCSFKSIAGGTSVFTLSGEHFLFIRAIKFLVKCDLPHYQK